MGTLSKKDVEKAIATMGKPEDFGAETMDEPVYQSTNTNYNADTPNYKTGKRLFRDPADEVIGGVASGLSAYFGITDPLWIRIGLVAFIFLGFGTPIIAYLILWIILPKAETASERLMMRGEEINASNIGRVVEEELDKFGNRVEQWGDEVNAKYGNVKKKAKKVAKGSAAGYVAPLRKGFIF